MSIEQFLSQLRYIIEFPESQKISLETIIADYWDSLGQVEILTFLDKEFGVSLTMDELLEIRTARDIIDLLGKRGIKF